MTIDTIKQLGAEFYHAADGVGEALRRLEHARADRLAFLRQCFKDSTARLATLKEELRTLPEQIAEWDAEAARLESQTAEDLLRQALEAGREAERALPRPVENCGHVAEDGTCGHPNAQAPTLLDLTKLPPGTVCEATGQIARGSHVILPGERFAFAGSSTEFLARVRVIERDESFDVPTVVYARVVEVPR